MPRGNIPCDLCRCAAAYRAVYLCTGHFDALIRGKLGTGDQPPPDAEGSEGPDLNEKLMDLSDRILTVSEWRSGYERLVGLLIQYIGDGGNDEGAAECLARKLKELAELREKVKAWDRVVRSGFALIDQVGNESGSASGGHGPQFDARLVELIQAVCALTPTELPQNLRPGSGSDEGKA